MTAMTMMYLLGLVLNQIVVLICSVHNVHKAQGKKQRGLNGQQKDYFKQQPTFKLFQSTTKIVSESKEFKKHREC